MALFKQYHFVLRPGQIVEGKSLVSDKTYRGRVLASIENPYKPAMCKRIEAVYVLCEEDKKVRPLEEIRLLEQTRGEGDEK